MKKISDVKKKVAHKVVNAREKNPNRFDSVMKKTYGFSLTIVGLPLVVALKITIDALDTNLRLFTFSLFLSLFLGLILFSLILIGVSIKIYFSQKGKIVEVEVNLRTNYEENIQKQKFEYESKLSEFNENFAVSLAAIMSQTNKVFMAIMSGEINPNKDKLKEIYIPSSTQFVSENATLPRLNLIELDEELDDD